MATRPIASGSDRSKLKLGIMPTTVTEAPYRLSSSEPARKRWTRAECAAFEATGLWDQQKLELIEGELIDKMGKKRPHTNGQTFTFLWLVKAFGGEFVNAETPIDIAPEDNPTSEPQPDATGTILTRTISYWSLRSPIHRSVST